MLKCSHCNEKFTIQDMLTAYYRGELTCSKCTTVYKQSLNLNRIAYFLFIYFIVFMFNKLVVLNFKYKIISSVAIIFIMFPLFDVIPHRWHKHKKVE